MQLVKTVLSTIVGLAILLLLVAGAGWAAYSSIAKAPAVVAAVVTGVAAILALAVQRYYEQRREEDSARREKLAPIYEGIIPKIYGLAANGGPLDEAELKAYFEDLTQSLLIWGSPGVILAFNGWRASVPTDGDPGPSSLLAFEQLLYAIRTDLGIDNGELAPGDLLRVFINDLDDHLLPSNAIRVHDNRSIASPAK